MVLVIAEDTVRTEAIGANRDGKSRSTFVLNIAMVSQTVSVAAKEVSLYSRLDS